MLALAAQFARVQCCPYIDPVQVLPANPTATDQVRLVFRATTPSQGNRISTNFLRSGNNLAFTCCYFSGPLAQPQNFSDTVQVGQLPVGAYTVTFVAQQSAQPQQCIEEYRNTNNYSLQVSRPLAATATAASGVMLYPVPAVGRQLTIALPATETLSRFELLDMAGRTHTLPLLAGAAPPRPAPTPGLEQQPAAYPAFSAAVAVAPTIKRPAHLRRPAVLLLVRFG